MYLGVTLDRTLSYKQHIEKVKGKVRTRNNLLHKLANSSWGANTFTLRATDLALYYSVAEYACPVWERSSHAKKVDASLNDSCRCITGCLRPTNVDSLYVLAGITPPGVHRSVASRTEHRRQADDTRHPCHNVNHQSAPSRLKSRKSFLHAVPPLSQPPQAARLALWEEHRITKQHLAKLPIPTGEQLAPGHKSEWKLWKSLNRLRTGMGRSKTNLSTWGYADTADTACQCGISEQTMQHLLRCPLLENECSLEDLATANDKALHCARAWLNIWLSSGMMDTKEDWTLWLHVYNEPYFWSHTSNSGLTHSRVHVYYTFVSIHMVNTQVLRIQNMHIKYCKYVCVFFYIHAWWILCEIHKNLFTVNITIFTGPVE